MKTREATIMSMAIFQQPMSKEDLEDDCSSGSDSGSVDSDESWEDTDDDSSLLEIEERLLEFAHIGTTPKLAEMVFNTADFKLAFGKPKQRGDDASISSDSAASENVLTKSSEKALANFALRRSNSDVFVQSASYTEGPKVEELDESLIKPEDCLREILDSQGITLQNFAANELDDFFLEMGDENFSVYDKAIATAFRTGDLQAVKMHIASGKTLQCCNKFRESVVHVTCRRNHEHLLSYMLEETDISICIQDDIGRTPLHDLAWTSVPNFEMVKMMVIRCPDLLYIKDNRGFTPLSYVGRNNWIKWCTFFEENREILAPQKLSLISL